MFGKIPANAFWNLVSIGSGALVSVGIPPFLTRALSPEVFGAWSLVLQMAGYVTLLGFGLQTVVSRHVSITEAAGDRASRDAIVSTAFWVLVVAAVIGGALLGLAAGNFARIFPGLSSNLVAPAAVAAWITGVGLAAGLPFQTLAGVFVGLQRNEVPAICQALSRLGLAAAVIFVALATGSLVWMAVAYLLANALGSALLWVLWASRTPSPTLAPSRVSRAAAITLARESLGLTVWSLAMILISGLSLIIVGRVDYGMVPYFAVAATLTLFMGGAMQALSAATLPVAARLVASGDPVGLTRLVEITTRISGAAGLFAASLLMIFGWFLLSLWVGGGYAERANGILVLLALAHGVRMAALPYVTAAVGAGLQGRMLHTPLIEGGVNLACSVALGQVFGATGVAVGMLVGAVVGLGALLWQHPLREAMGGGGVGPYVRTAILRVCRLLPLPLLAVWFIPLDLRSSALAVLLGALVIGSLCWLLALNPADRDLLRSYMRRVRAARPL